MKTAVITGGASGLGLELTKWFLNTEYKVIVVDRSPVSEPIYDFADDSLQYLHADLSKIEDIHRINELTINIESIDVFVLNAFPRLFKPFVDFEEREIINYVNTAYTHQMILLNSVLKKMIRQKFGKVIIIGSKSAFKGYSKGSLYCSLKMSYLGFFDAISRELNIQDSSASISIIHPDSFSDIWGNKMRTYEFVKTKVIKKVKLIVNGRRKSNQYYVFKGFTRILLFLNSLRQTLFFLFK